MGFEAKYFNWKIPSPADFTLYEKRPHSKQVALYGYVDISK